MSQRRAIATLAAVLVVPASLAGCGGFGDEASRETDTAFPADANYTFADTGGMFAGGDEGPGDPEVEDDFLALPPAQTDVYVFIANPNRNTVTRVNVFTYEVETTEVGVDPRIVATTADYSTAVVFNRGDDTVSLVDAATLTTRTVEVRDNLNSLVLSPDGNWAALWHDANAVRPDDPPSAGSQSFNEASFVNVVTGDHYGMTVGFNPTAIEFLPDSSLAVVVCDDVLTTVDLTTEPLVPDAIAISSELEPPAAEELVLAPDGSYAFVRQFGATELLIVDLDSSSVGSVPVGDNPTDLDLTPDGSRAVVVARSDHQLWSFEVANPYGAPQIIDTPPEVELGSLIFDPTGQQAVLYTTASLIARYATWDLATGLVTLRELVKPARTVAMAPNGESLLVFHTLEDAPDQDDSVFEDHWALTMIDLGDYHTNPLLLPSEPIGYANSSNGDYAYFIMEDAPFLEVLDYSTLLHDEYRLASVPVYVGVLPDLSPEDSDQPPAWVSQEHDLGRITFFDADEATLETITGFELNGGIE